MSVYFRFEGDQDQGVPDVDVSIDRKALESVKESLLSKLADDVWKTNEAAGTTAEEPIVTRPLEASCKDEWDPKLADMIVDAYQYHLDMKALEQDSDVQQPRLKLPSGIELEDALIILDYYGLTTDEDMNFDFDETRDDIHIRALLFLKWMKRVGEAKRIIIESIKADPKMATLFLFASSKYDMDYINDPKTNSKETFVRVGNEEECDSHFEWVQNERLRASLVSALEEESGLKARFMHENYYNDEELYSLHGPEECLLGIRPPELDHEGMYWEQEYANSEHVRVLEVTVPCPPAKRQRTR